MTEIIDLHQQRTPSRKMPEQWWDRLEDSTPLSDQELRQFASDAGPYLEDWLSDIESFGKSAKVAAEALELETRILQAAGYFDENGEPRTELQDQFFDGEQLRPEVLQQYRHLIHED